MNPERRGLINLATTSGGGELTEEAFMRTVEQVMRPRPPHHHLISSRAEPGSIVLCGDCGMPVRVPDVWP
jgi:hypothetical protein